MRIPKEYVILLCICVGLSLSVPAVAETQDENPYQSPESDKRREDIEHSLEVLASFREGIEMRSNAKPMTVSEQLETPNPLGTSAFLFFFPFIPGPFVASVSERKDQGDWHRFPTNPWRRVDFLADAGFTLAFLHLLEWSHRNDPGGVAFLAGLPSFIYLSNALTSIPLRWAIIRAQDPHVLGTRYLVELEKLTRIFKSIPDRERPAFRDLEERARQQESEFDSTMARKSSAIYGCARVAAALLTPAPTLAIGLTSTAAFAAAVRPMYFQFFASKEEKFERRFPNFIRSKKSAPTE